MLKLKTRLKLPGRPTARHAVLRQLLTEKAFAKLPRTALGMTNEQAEKGHEALLRALGG